MEAFTDELIRRRIDIVRRAVFIHDPLYNLHLMGDEHFSPIGADLWACEVVACRLAAAGLGPSGFVDGMPVPSAAHQAARPIPASPVLPAIARLTRCRLHPAPAT